MKPEAINFIIDKFKSGKPVEPGCRFHGLMKPRCLEICGASCTIRIETGKRDSTVEVVGDILVHSWIDHNGTEIHEMHIPCSSVIRAEITYA